MDVVQATDALHELFGTGWHGTPVVDFGVPGVPPIEWERRDRSQATIPDNAAFARFMVRHTGTSNRTIGPRGSRKAQTYGLVIAQLLAPWDRGKGYTNALNMSKVAKRLLHGVEFKGVTCTVARVNEIGRDGTYFQINVTANFYYFERV